MLKTRIETSARQVNFLKIKNKKIQKCQQCSFNSFDGRLKIVTIVLFNSQKANNTPELSVNYIQKGLFGSFSESEMVQLSMKADATVIFSLKT